LPDPPILKAQNSVTRTSIVILIVILRGLEQSFYSLFRAILIRLSNKKAPITGKGVKRADSRIVLKSMEGIV